MRTRLIFFSCLFLCLSRCQPVLAWPRLSNGATITTVNSGDRLTPFSLSVGTTTPVRLYTAAAKHREVTIENPSSSYLLYISTFSTFTNTSARLFVPKQGALTFKSTVDLWGLYESAAGAAIEVLGGYEYDSKD